MNILFIEDDPMNRRVVKDMLDVAGATMAEASWAEEGLEKIDAENFDVVLVDLRMRCLALGADDVLFKPVAMDALFDSIGRVLATRSGGILG